MKNGINLLISNLKQVITVGDNEFYFFVLHVSHQSIFQIFT